MGVNIFLYDNDDDDDGIRIDLSQTFIAFGSWL